MDKLRLNTDFIGFEGIIGRRDYFINILYIEWDIKSGVTGY